MKPVQCQCIRLQLIDKFLLFIITKYAMCLTNIHQGIQIDGASFIKLLNVILLYAQFNRRLPAMLNA